MEGQGTRAAKSLAVTRRMKAGVLSSWWNDFPKALEGILDVRGSALKPEEPR